MFCLRRACVILIKVSFLYHGNHYILNVLCLPLHLLCAVLTMVIIIYDNALCLPSYYEYSMLIIASQVVCCNIRRANHHGMHMTCLPVRHRCVMWNRGVIYAWLPIIKYVYAILIIM